MLCSFFSLNFNSLYKKYRDPSPKKKAQLFESLLIDCFPKTK